MDLADWKDAIAAEAAVLLACVEDGSLEPEDASEVAADLSSRLRDFALICLLVDGDTDLFIQNLMRSARARDWYLSLCEHEPAARDFRRAASRSECFWDALASSDFATATAIASRSPADWMPEAEYEDDFAYARLIYDSFLAKDREMLDAGLVRFERTSDGRDPARLALVRALVAPDQKNFDAAFDGLIDARQVEIARQRAEGTMEDGHVVADWRVFLEGLGILRLAERFGLATAPEYPLCPGLARLPMRKPFEP